MNLEKITLENIGCHSSADFSFSKLTTIYGENRTGKSTLIYSIFYALFGQHLSDGLNIKDLCRVGERFGATNLYFKNEDGKYRIVRQTDDRTAIYELDDNDGALSWRPIDLGIFDGLRDFQSITGDIAALTSFFREGELIYFIRDMPKYNKTLLQNIMQMDNVFITQSRFNKAMHIAKEKMGITSKDVRSFSDNRILEDSKKQVNELEEKFKSLDDEYNALLKQPDQSKYESLTKDYQKIINDIELLKEKKDGMAQIQDLKSKIDIITKQIGKIDNIENYRQNLHRSIGSLDQKIANAKTEIDCYKKLDGQRVCYTCGQELTTEHVGDLIARNKKVMSELTSEKEKLNTSLRHLDEYVSLINQMDELVRVEKDLNDSNNKLKKIENALNEYKNTDIEERKKRILELENLKNQNQKRLINAKVEYKQIEKKFEDHMRSKDTLKKLQLNLDIFEVAYQSIENAIRQMNRELLDRVKLSIQKWSSKFSFLSQFDIELKSHQVTPIIQAHGYQYKLNQMSKSERIFLYLLLKIAIGDALAHLGFFVLDDPADGLDEKRKNLLSLLLQEISENRQIIVTTNDKYFAGLFPANTRIDI